MRRVLLTLLAVTLLSAPIHAGYNRVCQSVRPLQAQDANELRNICTTTSINEKAGHWLTAAHCVGQPVFIDGQPAYVVMFDQADDLAVVRADVHVRGLKLQRDPAYVGEKLNLIGHPLGIGTIQWFRGYIASLDMQAPGVVGDQQHYMMFDMTSCHGNSGSAVVNSDDEIVSVLQIGMSRDMCGEFTGGVTWPVLVREISKYVG